MNAETDPKRGFRLLHWIAIVCAAGVLVLGFKIAGVFFLSADARAMQTAMTEAMDWPGEAQIQLSAGPALLSIGRWAALCIDDIPDEAHHALKAVRHASVGIYQRDRCPSAEERVDMMQTVDDRFTAKGWTRIVIVSDGPDLVMVYAPDDWESDEEVRFCLAVCDGREMVIVSAQARIGPLMELVKPHLPQGRMT